MSRRCLMILFVAGLLGGAASSEEAWYKGVTHIHSIWSDGDDAPEMIAAWYVDHGYDFMAFSDHNVLQQGDRYFTLDEKGRMKPDRVEDIRKRFGDNWVQTREVDGVLQMRLKTHDELRAHFNKPGSFLMLPAEEISSLSGGPHVNGVNLREVIAPEAGERTALIQRYIDAVRTQSEKYGVPMIAHVNHVNFAEGVTAEELIAVRGLEFFEVFNGHHGVYNWGNPEKGMPPTDTHWDIVQSLKMLEDPDYTLYGVATDDSHNYHDWRVGKANPGRGWIMVKAPELEATALIEAMKRGDFYASTGVALKRIERSDTALALEIDPAPGVKYTTQFIGTRRGFDTASEAVTDDAGASLPRATRKYSEEIGSVLLESTSLTPRYEFKGDELYVRARILSDRPKENPFAEGDFEMAWVQPVIVKR